TACRWRTPFSPPTTRNRHARASEKRGVTRRGSRSKWPTSFGHWVRMAKPTPTNKAKAPAAARAGNRRAPRRSRELGLQGLYEWLVGGHDCAEIEGHLMEHEGFERADGEHFRLVFHGAIDDVAALRADIARYIDREVKDLSPVEHAILLIGAYELKHRQ